MRSAYDAEPRASWPCPRTGSEPAEEEYSRVTDAARYAVVHARADAWATALSEVPGVRVIREDIDAGELLRLESARSSALPLVFTKRHVPLTAADGVLPVLDVDLGPRRLGIWPDCGCDACDWGSADLLAAIDDQVAALVGGPVVLLRGDDWEMQWTTGRCGWSSRGLTDDQRMQPMIEACRLLAEGGSASLPPGTEILVSRDWLS